MGRFDDDEEWSLPPAPKRSRGKKRKKKARKKHVDPRKRKPKKYPADRQQFAQEMLTSFQDLDTCSVISEESDIPSLKSEPGTVYTEDLQTENTISMDDLQITVTDCFWTFIN